MTPRPPLALARLVPLAASLLVPAFAPAQDAPAPVPPPAGDGDDGGATDPWGPIDTPTGDPSGDGVFELPASWGLAAGFRTGTIPYPSNNDSVSSFVPMMFFEGRHLYLRGFEGGVHLWREGGSELNLFTRLRFHDIPREYQNAVQSDSYDLGLQLRADLGGAWVDAEVLSDTDGRWHANARLGHAYVDGRWVVLPSLALRHDSARFVDHYYGLEPVVGPDPAGGSSGWELVPRVDARFHVISDLFLLGSLSYRAFSDSIRDLAVIDRSGVPEAFVGFGFFQDAGAPSFLGLPSVEAEEPDRDGPAPYVRLAHGWATPSNLGDILSGNSESDEFDNQLTSLFYGHPLTDSLFGLPVEIYVTPGAVFHHDSEVQDETLELVVALKAYVPITWPVLWRIGVAEGISWIDDVTYIERTDMEEKGYRPSEVMNYLDFSFDLNLGDLFGSKPLERLWLGYSIHHRSSIFESASQFGRIKGGSNYNTVYLQWDLW